MTSYISSSRYKLQTIEGESPVVVGTRKTTYGVEYYHYTAREGDTFDLLATRTFGNPLKWWQIADINPHIPFPDSIPVGTTVRIPKT